MAKSVKEGRGASARAERHEKLMSTFRRMQREGECCELPAEIGRIVLDRGGQFGTLEMDFTPGLNVITGGCGSGKTRIMRTIATFVPSMVLSCIASRPGALEFTGMSADESALRVLEIATIPGGSRRRRCIILDEPAARLDKEMRDYLNEWLKSQDCQVIVFTQRKGSVEIYPGEFHLVAEL